MSQKIDVMSLINQILCTYDEIAKRENLAINDLVAGLRGLFPQFNRLAQSIDEFKESVHEQFMTRTDFFNQRNWWYLHSMSASFGLQYCNDSVLEDEFNELLVEHFKENDFERLKAIINKWPAFGLDKNLFPAVNQIFSAHMRGEYYLSVAAMIPVVERLILLTHNKHYSSAQHKTGKAIKEFGKDFEKNKIYYSNFLFILELFFKSGEFGDLDTFNRHKIIHGQTVEYGRELYSLKLLLAIDEILRFRNLIEVVNFDRE